jgi:hypothetical protein
MVAWLEFQNEVTLEQEAFHAQASPMQLKFYLPLYDEETEDFQVKNHKKTKPIEQAK